MPSQQQQQRGESPIADLNRGLSNDAQRIAYGAADLIVPAGTTLQEPLTADNRIWLLTGDHGGFVLSKANTHVRGASGSRVLRQVVVRESARLEGLHFRSVDSSGASVTGSLVDVTTTTGTVFFIGCIFEKQTTHASLTVQIAAGARAHFIGCTFGPAGMPVGFVVNNAGVPGVVGIIGCSNLTGRVHNNATILFETV